MRGFLSRVQREYCVTRCIPKTGAGLRYICYYACSAQRVRMVSYQEGGVTVIISNVPLLVSSPQICMWFGILQEGKDVQL